MRSILIVSHGSMARGIYESASMIYGKLTNVKYLCLEGGNGIELFSKSLDVLLDDINSSDEIVILADLKGGSPYNTAISKLSEKGLLEKSVVFSGMNLPMLLSLLFISEPINEEIKRQILEDGKAGIDTLQLTLEEDEII